MRIPIKAAEDGLKDKDQKRNLYVYVDLLEDDQVMYSTIATVEVG